MKKSFFISKVVLYLHHQTKQNASKQQANNLKKQSDENTNKQRRN